MEEYRAFLVNIISAQGQKGVLDFVNFYSTMKVYAVVSVIGTPPDCQQTPLANYFGDNPVWNYAMRFHLPELKLRQNALTLRIKLLRKRIFGPHEAIAEACVPLMKLFHSTDYKSVETNFNFCELLSPSGRSRGYLFYSYAFDNTYSKRAANNGAPPKEADPPTVAPVVRRFGRPVSPAPVRRCGR